MSLCFVVALQFKLRNVLLEVWEIPSGTSCIYKVKVKWSRYRPGVAQRVGRGIALLLHDRGTRRQWVVSSTPWPHFTPGKDSVPNVQEVGWAAGPVWRGGKSRPHRDSIPDRPARSQSLYRLSYPAHTLCVCVCVCMYVYIYIYIYIYIHTRVHTYIVKTYRFYHNVCGRGKYLIWGDAWGHVAWKE